MIFLIFVGRGANLKQEGKTYQFSLIYRASALEGLSIKELLPLPIKIFFRNSFWAMFYNMCVYLWHLTIRKIWHSPVPGNIFRWDFPFFRLSLMAINFHGNGISSKFQKACFYSYNVYLRKFKSQLLGVILGAHHTPKIGCFFQIDEI